MTDQQKLQNMKGIHTLLERGPLTGTCSVTGRAVDNRGTIAILKARQQGITDPDQLRAISRDAKA